MALCIALAAAGQASAQDASVARAHLRGAGTAGAVFFLPLDEEPGAVAVGTAHAFDRTQLAESGEVEFRLGGDGERLAVSNRYYTQPGRGFHEPGATLRDDFVVFALDAPPEGIRLLEPARDLPRPGGRVRVLGIPSQGSSLETQVLGTVLHSEETHIEVDLDSRADLRGWGGAPVLEAEGNRVVGLLQSAWPSGDGLRIGVGPISGVVEALSRPYEGGIGRLFATLARPVSAANSPGARRRAATGSAFGDQDPNKSAAEVIAAATLAESAPRSLSPPTLHLEIEEPRPDAIVGEAAGVFVAGRAISLRDRTRRFDIIVVIDTSASTGQPTGVDVDQDGVVGIPLPGSTPEHPKPGSTDPGDSILAAEVAAAEKLLAGLDPRSTRVGVVSFAGLPDEAGLGGLAGLRVRRAALTEEPLTSDYTRLRVGLARVRERGANGMTHMAAGVDQATLELHGLAGSISHADPESEKVVLFFTDGEPTLPHPMSEVRNVRAVLESAQRARRAGVRIHSFAIGPEALAGPISTVEMASITDGFFTPVRDPGRLVQFIDGVSFANIAKVEVENTTSGERAYHTRVHADGSWDALVPLRTGRNQLEVRAQASDGAMATARVTVAYAPGSASPFIPAELLSKHNELLEMRLQQLRSVRIEALRQELAREIEVERAAALERAAQQRKELELEALKPDGP